MSEPDIKYFNSQINSYLDSVEEHAQMKMKFRDEIKVIIQSSQNVKMNQEYEELIFLGKFISNAHSILKRLGNDSVDTIKLAAEYRKSIEKSAEILKNIFLNTPEQTRNSMENKFLSHTHNSLNDFLELLYELSWLKNYSLDKNNC